MAECELIWLLGGAEMTRSHTLSDLVERLSANGRERRKVCQDRVSIDDIHRALGSRSFGPLILFPALIEISPVGGIPGVPTLLALVIVFVAAQILVGRHHVWLPGFVANRSISADAMENAVYWMRKPARWLDRVARSRLTWLTYPPFDRVVATVCIVLMVPVAPLEFIPLASTLPMAAVVVLGFALLTDDGLLVAIGLVFASAALAGAIYWIATLAT